MRTKTRLRLPLVLTILGVLLLALILILILRKPAPVDPHAGQVYVYDGFDWVWMTPLEGVPVNDLTEADFTMEGSFPRYNGERYDILQGIDVSMHQYDVDWKQVAASGVDFAMVRLGWRGYTEGGLFLDEYFERNIHGAISNGMSVGVYFFSQAVNVQEAIEEARFVIEHLRGYNVRMPVVFDWEKIEGADNARTNELSAATRTDCAVAFCETVKNAGYQPCVYFNRHIGYYGFDLSRLTDYDFWFALPEMGYPSFYYAVDMWQYSVTEHIQGVNSPADMNLYFIPCLAEDADSAAGKK